MFTSAALAICLLQPAALQPDFVSLFTPLEFHFTGGKYRDQLFSYRLFVPDGATPDNKLPLIVWLHGYGERGEDNAFQLRWLDELVFDRPWDKSRYPFFLLAVQCPDDNAKWVRRRKTSAPEDMIDVAAKILDEVLKNPAIDENRVYLTGISSGGSGCWAFAAKYPKYFAAVAPLASGGTKDNRIAQIKDIPVWTFHSRDDGGVKVDYVRNTVRRLKSAGGNVYLTEIDSAEHNCWSAAFHDYRLLDWLLAQRRGKHIWQWWQIAVQIVFLAVASAATYYVCTHHRQWRARWAGINSTPQDQSAAPHGKPRNAPP